MHLSRRASWFLLAFGGWSWFIWITFVRNLWKDSSGLAFEDGDPTGYFWVHLALAVTSFALGTAVGVLGLRGVRASRRAAAGARAAEARTDEARGDEAPAGDEARGDEARAGVARAGEGSAGEGSARETTRAGR